MEIQIDSKDADQDEIERLAILLKRELEELDLDVHRKEKNNIPDGARSGLGLESDSLLLMLPSAINFATSLTGLFQTWISRDKDRSLTLKMNGKELHLSGLSSKDQNKIIEDFIKLQKKD